LKVKLRGRTIEVIETETQAVLNTLTEHDFQNALKKMAEALGTAHTRERGQLRG
jgi:predicted helicase